MKKVSTGTIAIDQGVVNLISDFDTGGEMWSGSGPRERRTRITFAQPFDAVPSVHLSLSMFDMDHKHNQRFDLEAVDLATDGFTIVFRTWSDTRIARARATWLALGSVGHEDDWLIP